MNKWSNIGYQALTHSTLAAMWSIWIVMLGFNKMVKILICFFFAEYLATTGKEIYKIQREEGSYWQRCGIVFELLTSSDKFIKLRFCICNHQIMFDLFSRWGLTGHFPSMMGMIIQTCVFYVIFCWHTHFTTLILVTVR